LRVSVVMSRDLGERGFSALSIEDVFRRLLPFFGSLVVLLLIVIFTPSLSLWLPTTLGLMTP